MKKTYKIIAFILITVLLIMGLSGCGEVETSNKKSKSKGKNNTTTVIKNEDNWDNTTVINSTEKVEKKEDKVQVEALGLTRNGDFAFKVINNNDEPVYIETVNTIFKDENGNFAEKAQSDIQYFTVDANSEVVNYAWGFDKDFSKYTNYEFECEFSESFMKNYFLTVNFEVTANNTGTQIAVSVKNNNSVDVKSMETVVAYYSDGKIVGCQMGYNDTTIKEGSTAYLNVQYPEDSRYNEVAFDNYEVYLMQASID